MTKPMYFPSGFDTNQAILCNRLVNCAYDMYEQWKHQDEPEPKKFDWTINGPKDFDYGKPIWGESGGFLWKDHEPFAFVASDIPSGRANKTVYIVFRGTQTGADWLSNLRADLTRYTLVAGYGEVHEGFCDLYKTMRRAVINQLASFSPVKKLVVCGHSLGAALSTLAVPHVINKSNALAPNCKTIQYNLASPRVASPGFANAYNANGVPTFRIVNIEDVVPDLPLPAMGSELFQHVGVSVDFSAQCGSLAENHSSTSTYLYALKHPNNPQG